MSLGASLVADDRCDLADSPEGIIVSRPDTLPEAIEARGLGILSARCAGPTRLSAVLDLDEVTTDRLPARSTVWIEQHKLPLLANSAASHLPAALLLFLKNGFHGSMLP
ncbi:Hpr serine kinase/phosphatase domain protein [Litoreibacter arenae DSM 19593]|uniref:Hpr serine kinase/phosphatase domain protein n=2 Tax=Litoreibacter TaxID=947567 RepID=S9QA94_9RHOB|nr:Hpr serine kinase/phosphatase domain protein [Litoreibacter arenae DSM 19593]